MNYGRVQVGKWLRDWVLPGTVNTRTPGTTIATSLLPPFAPGRGLQQVLGGKGLPSYTTKQPRMGPAASSSSNPTAAMGFSMSAAPNAGSQGPPGKFPFGNRGGRGNRIGPFAGRGGGGGGRGPMLTPGVDPQSRAFKQQAAAQGPIMPAEMRELLQPRGNRGGDEYAVAPVQQGGTPWGLVAAAGVAVVAVGLVVYAMRPKRAQR